MLSLTESGPLAPLFAQARQAIRPGCTPAEALHSLHALSVIERHVQEMEQALTHIAEGWCSCGGKFWTEYDSKTIPATAQTRCENCGRHRGYGAPHYTIAIARAALPAREEGATGE